MMSTASSPSSTHLMTADELLGRSSELGRCELVRGELIRMTPPGGTHGWLAAEIARHLGNAVEGSKLGRVYGEVGFILERDPDTVRAPDVAFIATDRLAEADTPQYIPIAPDLAVEVNSPHDRAGEVAEKVGWWLRHGTRMVWVVDPRSRTVTSYLPDGSARVLQHDQTLGGGEVLPGVSLNLVDLFPTT